MENEIKSTGCCERFDPAPWQDKEFTWENKKFVKAKVFTLFYMPINFGSVIVKLMAKIKEAGANLKGNICLSDHTSMWNMNIYIAVDKEVTGADNITFSGTYYSRVYEDKFNETGKWCKDFEKQTKSKNLNIKKLYMWYTTCPACAKAYGKNYVVLVGQIN
jgi:hypothetical protein